MGVIDDSLLKEVKEIRLINEFKEFLTKSNAMALAIGVIIGGASTKLVNSIAADLIMPIVGVISPGKSEWSETVIPLIHGQSIKIGDFFENVLAFVMIAFVVFIVTKAVLKPAPDAPTQICPYCKESVPADATKCKACTSALTPVF